MQLMVRQPFCLDVQPISGTLDQILNRRSDYYKAGGAQARTGRPGDRGSIPGGGKRIFFCNSCVRTGFVARPASCTVGIGGPFSGSKALPGRDADQTGSDSPKALKLSCCAQILQIFRFICFLYWFIVYYISHISF
jgi:hypothetical protein